MSLMIDKKGRLYNTAKYFLQYSVVTKIHGLRFVGQSRPSIERLLWGLITLASLFACILMIVRLYIRFRQSPVVVSFETQMTPIDHIPFPAVTICPETKTRADIFNYRETANKIRNRAELTEFERNTFAYYYLICQHVKDHKLAHELDDRTYNDDFFKTVSELSPKFEEVIHECEWMLVGVNCSKIFTPVFTDQGVCYSFNLLDKIHLYKDTASIPGRFFDGINKSNDWGQNKDGIVGYKDLRQIDTYPRRALMAGRPYSLAVVMKLRLSDFDIECKQAFQGFRVVIGSPFSIPSPSKHYFRVSPDDSVLASVSPKMIVTSATVGKFSAKSRHCYMRTDRFLKYFKTYGRQKCFLECLSNYTLRRCECISYFMPREHNTSICGAFHQRCVSQAIDELELLEIRYHLNRNKAADRYCGCLPSCAAVGYDVEVTSSEMRSTPGDGFTESRLTVHFESDFFMKRVRHEIFSQGDLIAKFGGLLSLFTGVSVITIIEIIYFLSVRLFCNKYMYGSWTGPGTEEPE